MLKQILIQQIGNTFENNKLINSRGNTSATTTSTALNDNDNLDNDDGDNQDNKDEIEQKIEF